VLAVDRPGAGEGRYVVRLRGPDGAETTVDADAVVLAVPAPAVAAATRTLTPELASLVDGFRMGSTVTVNLGYADGLPALEGHGCLVPSRAGRVARACTWSSRKFGGRAPEGHTLVRVSLGGATAPLTGVDDATLVALAREELATIAGVTAEPVLARVHAWREVMPVYTVGHPDRVARAEQVLADVPGLVVAGSAFYGVSVPDCIASADRAASAVVATLGTPVEVAVVG
jgi:oxygen-dependent protoporphyrinogen oxidase